ncbi:conserved domain protein [Actinomyces sp. oral taxon 170 str. F0386]|nr:conserved domain protein [Actinomyces sp. oral taxon 170 str. F0386]
MRDVSWVRWAGSAQPTPSTTAPGHDDHHPGWSDTPWDEDHAGTSFLRTCSSGADVDGCIDE